MKLDGNSRVDDIDVRGCALEKVCASASAEMESFILCLRSPAYFPISDNARTEKLKTDLPDWPEPDDSSESFEAWGKHLFSSNDNYRWCGYQLGDYSWQWHYNTTSMCPSRTLESLRPATSTLHLKPKASVDPLVALSCLLDVLDFNAASLPWLPF